MLQVLDEERRVICRSSSAMNCVGAVFIAQMLGPGHTIVTILCDSGARHFSKFQNALSEIHNLSNVDSSILILKARESTMKNTFRQRNLTCWRALQSP